MYFCLWRMFSLSKIRNGFIFILRSRSSYHSIYPIKRPCKSMSPSFTHEVINPLCGRRLEFRLGFFCRIYFEYAYFRILRWCIHDCNENDTHVIHLYNSKPMPPKQSWRMPLSSSSSYSSCHDYIMLLSVYMFDFASWYDNQSSVTFYFRNDFNTLS